MKHAQQLVRRAGRIGQRSEDIEDGSDAELLAHRRRMLHRAVMAGRKHEADAGLGYACRDFSRLEHDLGTERFEHVGAARLRRHRASAVLGDPRPSRGGDEHRRGGDVEGGARAAAGAAAALEMLGVCAASPPVPTMSSRWSRSGTSTLVANSRMTCPAAAISPTVSFFTLKPRVNAAIITGDASP